MISQERWDVILKVVSGPLEGLGDQVLRGPVVRIGVNPGPGGLQLTGYRGLDARQAVITAYDEGTASIAPVGTNQVRMAPHANVNWKEVDPISKPQYLNEGCAIHLGPVGRGCTLEFVKCQRLGAWQGGAMSSSVEPGGGPSGGVRATALVQKGIKVKSVRTSTAPVWFLGCLMLLVGTAVPTVLAIGFIRGLTPDPPGPTEEGPEIYWRQSSSPPTAETRKEIEGLDLLNGLEKGFGAFVMQPNIDQSGRLELRGRDHWDEKFYEMTVTATLQHVQWKRLFRKYEDIKGDYATVVGVMRDKGLPDVFAAVPIRESNYTASATSTACAHGYWQFMPEVAHRLEVQNGLDFVVRYCKFKDADVVWNPTLMAPPRDVYKNGDYIANRLCRIKACAKDDRSDLRKSTAAAAFDFNDAYNDPTLKASGAVVQMTIATHNTGYNDERFGLKKTSNVLPGFTAWSAGRPASDHSNWYGENMTCLDAPEGQNYCGGSKLHRDTQNYVYPIVAQHLLAVCYYAQNHATEYPEFQAWAMHVREDGYCKKFKIPTPDQVKP